MPNRWSEILDSLRKSGSRELKEGVYQLCSYYQCTLFERSPLWYLANNQMIQNKRSQLVRGINICCSAYGWCRHMLWSICLVCQVEQANPWGKTPTNISTSKKFAFTIFPDEMCKWRQIRFPPTTALVNLFWQVVVGWRENLLCKLFVTLRPSRKWCFKRRQTQASLSCLSWLSLEKGVSTLVTMLHKSSGFAARDWLHVLWEPTFQ